MFFHIIVVVYNQKIETKNVSPSSVILYIDNSTSYEIKDYNNAESKKGMCRYIDMHGNAGLPKAYNTAISNIEKNKDTWVILLDQDTVLNDDFIEKYRSAIINNPDKKVFCPVIKDDVGIMSPSIIKGKSFSHSNKCDFNAEDLSRFSFINSGMCINSTIFNKLKYDENLFLDMVDHAFVRDIKNKYGSKVFYVINDIDIHQNFSGVTKNSFSSDLNRYRILVKDQSYYYNKYYGNTLYSNFKLLARALKLCLQHKNFGFLKVFGERR